MSIKNESFEWAKIPEGLERKYIVKVVAKTTTSTDHTKDMSIPESQRKIRHYSKEELMLAARSLALRPIDVNHDLDHPITNAFVIDAQSVDDKIEAICYIPSDYWIAELKANRIKGVSVEEINREDVPIDALNVDVKGIIYTGLALVTPPFQAGDPNTQISPMFEALKGHLFFEMVSVESVPAKEPEKVVEPEKKPEPSKEELMEKRVQELEDTVTRMQKTVAESDKKTREAFEKGKKEGKTEVIKKVEEVIPSVLVQRQGSYAVNRLVVDLKRKLREESQ